MYELRVLNSPADSYLTTGILSFLLSIHEYVRSYIFYSFFINQKRSILIRLTSFWQSVYWIAVRQQCQISLGNLNIGANKSVKIQSIVEALQFHDLVDNVIFKVDCFRCLMVKFYQMMISARFDRRSLLEVAKQATCLKFEIDQLSKRQFIKLKQSHRALDTLLCYKINLLANPRGSFE